MEKEKNSNGLLIVLMVILALLMCASFVGLCFMMVEADNLRKEVDELKEQNTDKEEKAESTKCQSVVGAYYAEVINDSLNMKKTFAFSENGSFITYVENGGAAHGTYMIKDGVVTLTQNVGFGPEVEEVTYSYNVSDDCETIYVNDDDLSYELKLIKE